MLCGIEWWTNITRKNAYRIMRFGNFTVIKGYNSRREEWMNGEPNSFVRNGKYRCWILQIKKEGSKFRLIVRGSLHKFYHGENSGFFSGLEVLGAIEGMCDLFEVKIEEIMISNIEVGVNIDFPYPVFQYLEANLLYHKKKMPVLMDSKPALGFFFRYDEYRVKLYQKSIYTLRFEMKYTAKAKLNEFGIKTALDLNKHTIIKLTESLIPQWDEIVLRGGINVIDEKDNPNGLTRAEIKKLLQYSSKFYQQGYAELLKSASGRMADNLQVKSYRLRKFCMDVINKKGDGIHAMLRKKIEEQVLDFKNVWKSAYDKKAENHTIMNKHYI